MIPPELCPTKRLKTGLKDAFSYGAAVISDLSRAGPQGRKQRTRSVNRDSISIRKVISAREALLEVANCNCHFRRLICLGRPFLKDPLEPTEFSCGRICRSFFFYSAHKSISWEVFYWGNTDSVGKLTSSHDDFTWMTMFEAQFQYFCTVKLV